MKKLLLLTCALVFAASAVAAQKSAGKPAKKSKAERIEIGKHDVYLFERWVLENMSFPESIYQDGETGMASVRLGLAGNGKINNITPLEASESCFADEACRVIKSAPGFVPAASWKPVPDGMICQMEFRLHKVPGEDGADSVLRAENTKIYKQADKMPTFESEGPRKFVGWLRHGLDSLRGGDTSYLAKRVVLGMVIEKDGSMSGIEINEAAGAELTRQIGQLLVFAPRWTPAVTCGDVVRLKTQIPLSGVKRPFTASDDQEKPQTFVETMPSFQGGNLADFRAWVMENVKYPQEALSLRVEGRVTVVFVVERDGSITNVRIANTPSELLVPGIEELFCSSPKWEPGIQRGKAVRVQFVLPVDFRISKTSLATRNPHAPNFGRSR